MLQERRSKTGLAYTERAGGGEAEGDEQKIRIGYKFYCSSILTSLGSLACGSSLLVGIFNAMETYSLHRSTGGGIEKTEVGKEREARHTYIQQKKKKTLGYVLSLRSLSRLLRRWSSPPPLLLHRRCRFFYRALSLAHSQSHIVESLRALLPPNVSKATGEEGKREEGLCYRDRPIGETCFPSPKVSFSLFLFGFFCCLVSVRFVYSFSLLLDRRSGSVLA